MRIESLSYTYRDELYHHGIKGMKWGVRRFQNEDGSLTSAGERRYNAIDRTKTRVRGAFEGHRAIVRNVKKADGLVNKASELLGQGRAETLQKNRARVEKRLAEQSNTRLGKRLHTINSYNSNELAKYHKTVRNMDIGQRMVNDLLFNSAFVNTKVKNLSGRESTYGKELVLATFTAGFGNLALDAVHIVKNKGSYA